MSTAETISRTGRLNMSATRRGIGLMLPAAGLMAVLTVVPVIAVLERALTSTEAFGQLFDAPNFGRTMLNTLVWTLVSVAGALLIGYAAALLLRSPFLLLRGAWRGLFMIPWIIPGVVGATVWSWSVFGSLCLPKLDSVGDLVRCRVSWRLARNASAGCLARRWPRRCRSCQGLLC
ncbi:hypothetical protein ACQP2T_19000 [Nonomuraea sp. CA-143628]|uniref:hypothetical protein n=1 Tax=Nonomuraea sp. CA-143628 TaxID=3239997 RepID=UPI003D9138C5